MDEHQDYELTEMLDESALDLYGDRVLSVNEAMQVIRRFLAYNNYVIYQP